jgi:hypothetical protein
VRLRPLGVHSDVPLENKAAEDVCIIPSGNGSAQTSVSTQLVSFSPRYRQHRVRSMPDGRYFAAQASSVPLGISALKPELLGERTRFSAQTFKTGNLDDVLLLWNPP